MDSPDINKKKAKSSQTRPQFTENGHKEFEQPDESFVYESNRKRRLESFSPEKKTKSSLPRPEFYEKGRRDSGFHQPDDSFVCESRKRRLEVKDHDEPMRKKRIDADLPTFLDVSDKDLEYVFIRKRVCQCKRKSRHSEDTCSDTRTRGQSNSKKSKWEMVYDKMKKEEDPPAYPKPEYRPKISSRTPESRQKVEVKPSISPKPKLAQRLNAKLARNQNSSFLDTPQFHSKMSDKDSGNSQQFDDFSFSSPINKRLDTKIVDNSFADATQCNNQANPAWLLPSNDDTFDILNYSPTQNILDDSLF